MKPTQFRILYRHFLFRMADLEVLSADAQGDTSKLLGQFAALLVFISIFPLSLIGAGMGGADLVFQWSGVHFMIAATMLAVGLFAVLSWDSTFPDRQDVMVLAPLPIPTRTIFFAKIAAVATALSLTVVTLHIAAGLVWPLSLSARHGATVAPSIAYDAAMAPLGAAELGTILMRDLGPVLKRGMLAPGTGRGATVGVWTRGEQRVFAYGAAKPNSEFEIGSITKTFTALALAQLVVKGTVGLDEPVRELLPPDSVRRTEGAEITLLDLATHFSGLPRVPNNLHSPDRHNPYAGYDTDDLYAFLGKWGLARPRYPSFSYSNLGFGLLGHALANRAGVRYTDLIAGITEPLGMHHTVVSTDLGVLAGAGAIRSTAADMLLYLVANLHPARTDLQAAIGESQKLHARIAPGASIALAWVYDHNRGTYQHDGGTAGYTSDALFSPKGDFAAVVLTNIQPDFFQFASVLAEHIRARLVGQRAISLNSAAVPASGGGVLDFLRLLGVWWGTMMAAGAFIYCCILGAQGLAAQLLPRPYFLRVSSFLQLAAFGILVFTFFAEPKLVTPSDLILPQSSVYLEWSPSYWFLGLFQQLNGSPALPELAFRAWVAMSIAFGATVLAYSLAYFRTMRRIAEEPDIAPAWAGRNRLPRFGSGFATAVVQFSIRTLMRSRQHRLLLAFYLGIGFAAAILFRKSDEAARSSGEMLGLAPLCSTIAILVLCVVGMRVVFALPTDMRANWIFRIAPAPSGRECMAARRRALYVLSVVPVCLGTAALLFSIWPWEVAAKHLLMLLLLGAITAELCLRGTQKLPFTCSWLPGKSNFNITLLLSSTLGLLAIVKAAQRERASFEHRGDYISIVLTLTALAICLRWNAARQAKSSPGELRFEESAEPAVFALDLHRDGVTAIDRDATGRRTALQ